MSKADDGIQWREPPEGRKMYDWPRIAERLRAHPNEWGMVFEQDRASVVHAIRQEAITAFGPNVGLAEELVTRGVEGFEIRTTNNVRGTPRTCDLYMRYVPARRKRKR